MLLFLWFEHMFPHVSSWYRWFYCASLICPSLFVVYHDVLTFVVVLSLRCSYPFCSCDPGRFMLLCVSLLLLLSKGRGHIREHKELDKENIGVPCSFFCFVWFSLDCVGISLPFFARGILNMLNTLARFLWFESCKAFPGNFPGNCPVPDLCCLLFFNLGW